MDVDECIKTNKSNENRHMVSFFRSISDDDLLKLMENVEILPESMHNALGREFGKRYSRLEGEIQTYRNTLDNLEQRMTQFRQVPSVLSYL